MDRKGSAGSNFLLVKSEVGRSKQSTRNLPLEDHAYGMPNKVQAFGASNRKYL